MARLSHSKLIDTLQAYQARLHDITAMHAVAVSPCHVVCCMQCACQLIRASLCHPPLPVQLTGVLLSTLDPHALAPEWP